MFSFVFTSAFGYAVACCLRIAICRTTIGNYIVTSGSAFTFLSSKATGLIQITLVVFSIPIARDNHTARLARPRSGAGTIILVVGEDGAGGKEKGGGLEGGLANERLRRQPDAVGCGGGFSPSGLDVGFLAQNREEAFCFPPGLTTFGCQELQIGQDMSKGCPLLSHRINVSNHVCNFLFDCSFCPKQAFPCQQRGTINRLWKRNKPFFEEKSLFSKEIWFANSLVILAFRRRARFYSS